MLRIGKAPILLAHGIAPFDGIKDRIADVKGKLGGDPNGLDNLDYFSGIKRELEANGFSAYHTQVGFASDIATMARQFKEEVRQVQEETKEKRVHVIGHSFAGRYVRLAILDGLQDAIISLTTIGTPHIGTSFADVGLAKGGTQFIAVLEKLGINWNGFKDLTTTSARAFNQWAEPEEAKNRVSYSTWGSHEPQSRVFLPLKFSWSVINQHEGPNDGLVPLGSQLWTPQLKGKDGTQKAVAQHTFPIPADHLNQFSYCDIN